MKKIPFIGAAFAALTIAQSEMSDDTREEKNEAIGRESGGAIGAIGGAAIGAAIGTAILPGVGTAIGGALGAFLGSEAGAIVGEHAARFFDSEAWSDITSILSAGFESLVSVTHSIVESVSSTTEGLNSYIKNMTGVDVGAGLKVASAATGRAVDSAVSKIGDKVDGFEEKNNIKKGAIGRTVKNAGTLVTHVLPVLSPLKWLNRSKKKKEEAKEKKETKKTKKKGFFSWFSSDKEPEQQPEQQDEQDKTGKAFKTGSFFNKKKPKKVPKSRRKRWEAAKGDILGAANKADVDPGILAMIANFESKGFNPNARPISSKPEKNKVRQFDGTMAISSAHGYGQFLDSTWTSMINKHGSKYGIEDAGKLDKKGAAKYRTDTKIQAGMLAEFTKENISIARNIGGGSDDAANVYAMHNLGEGQGSKFLKALKNNPESLVSSFLPSNVIKGNGSLYGKGNVTVKEAYERMGSKMREGEVFSKDARASSKAAPITDSKSDKTEALGVATVLARSSQVNPIKPVATLTPKVISPPLGPHQKPEVLTNGLESVKKQQQPSSMARGIPLTAGAIGNAVAKALANNSKEEGLEQGKSSQFAPHIPTDIEDAYWQRMTRGIT